MNGNDRIEIVTLEELDLVFGELADPARRFAAMPTAAYDSDNNLYSLKVPYCITLAEIDGSVKAAVKEANAPQAAEDLEGAGDLLSALSALVECGANRDSESLGEMEKAISKIEENLIKNRRNYAASRELIRYRKTLLVVKQRYEKIRDLTDELLKKEGTDSRLIYEIRRRAERIVEEDKTLRDYLGEVRDAHQSAIQVGQNRLMQTFTVIAAIFMPLQLVTGWFGMNLIMPEFNYPIAYPIVAGACVILVVVLLIVFKKRHWL